ncbi:alpha/beta fold hydrolase [Candidatus Woesearchaeota archaeon]|nr:alpha/beta fold hydrolase [Candidatus Woesearchaeota archaeon]
MKKTAKEKPEKSIKNFIRRNKKTAIAIAAAFLLILSFSGYRAWLNFHFLTTDDLVLNLEPGDKSLSIHYGETPNVTVSLDIENSFMCNALCSYEFRDISNDIVIDKGTFTSKGIGKKFDNQLALSADRAGSGQKIYTFDVKCNNIRTFYCPTNEEKRKRSIFITLNYDISEYEKFLKEALKGSITKIAEDLNKIDIEIQQLNNRFFELGFKINLNEIEDDKEILNNNHDATVIELKNIERIWPEENYVMISELFNRSYEERLLNITMRINDIGNSISSIIKRHNSLVDAANNADDELRKLNDTIIFLNRADKKMLDQHKQLLNRTSALKIKIKENSFPGYDFLENESSSIVQSMKEFREKSKNFFSEVYLKGTYYASIEKEKLCAIKGNCKDKTDFSAAIMNSLGIDDNKLISICTSLATIKENYNAENNKSDALLDNYNFDEIKGILNDTIRAKTMIAGKNVFNQVNGINASSELNNSLNILLSISRINFTDEDRDYGNFTESEILSLIKMNFSEDSELYFGNNCAQPNEMNISQYYGEEIKIDKAIDTEAKNFTSRAEIKLTENYPVCCVFGECKRCCTSDECRNDESLYPVLFLHGHALNSDNSPEYSLDAFNKIQAKLQEDGYISAGTITPVSDYSEVKEGEWGLSSRPLSVKGSYYLVSYYNLGSYALTTQKSENIETYAIRLKELIDLLKFRTGKDKVIIVAHSMGSLVSRSYLQIFGDEDVDKLIMIAAPNKGISGSVSNYCPVLGEKKECQDMNEGSIFMKKLNDPNKIPGSAKIYNIIGTGCSMDGTTGDGIVTRENAELGYAENFYVNGTCEGISGVMHTQILNIDQYPEVYEAIGSVLRK